MRVREVRVGTAWLAEMRRFYGEVLGLPVAPRDDGAAFEARVGPSTLVFEAAAPDDEGVCHFAFNVPENQIVEARDWIRPRAPILPDGAEEIVDFASWNAHAVYFQDPGGHVVELIARHALPNASDAPFGPTSLLEISEVGVPVDDVGAAIADLEACLGETPWRRPGERFAPVGDDHGLVILVKKGRPWFPTGEVATTPRRLHVGAARRYEGVPGALGVEVRGT